MKTLWNKLFHPTERTKLIICVSATGLLILLAALVPLSLRRTPSEPPETATAVREARMALFARYWAENDPAVVAEPWALTETEKNACREKMDGLIARFIPDRALKSRVPTGQEYLHLSDGTESGADFCRMWLEARGDWQNWLDVCFDPETGLPFYFCLSRECIDRPDAYAEQLDLQLDAAGVAEIMAEELGWTPRYLMEDGEGVTAVFRAGDEILCYHITCTSYGTLLDIRICCR